MRVAVIFPGALGDFCLLAPVLAALRAGGTEVALSVRRPLVPIAATLLPDAALGPPADGTAMASLFGAALAPEISAWLRGVDRVHVWFRQGDVERRISDAGVEASFHAVPRGDAERHVSDDYAWAVGVPPPAVLGCRPRLPVSSRPALPWCGPAGGRLLLHPGAGSRDKRWPADGFRRVADDWVHAGGEVLVLLGPAEEGDIEWWRSGPHPVIEDLALADAPAAIVTAPRWIGNDSGMSHLGAALGRRGVVLFGPTRPERWQPRGDTLTAVRFHDRDVDEVLDEARGVLGAPTDLDTPTPRH